MILFIVLQYKYSDDGFSNRSVGDDSSRSPLEWMVGGCESDKSYIFGKVVSGSGCTCPLCC